MTRTVSLKDLRLEFTNWTNPRSFTGLSDKDIDELGASIDKEGILDPPKVVMIKSNGDTIDLVIDGQRRVLAGLKVLPKNTVIEVIDLEESPIDPTPEKLDELMLKALTIGQKREGLSSYELAEVAGRLRGRDRPLADIADAIGKSESWVSRMLKAQATATPKLMLSWRRGEITDEQFKDLAVERDPDKQIEDTQGVVDARKAGNKAEARAQTKELAETAKQKKARKKREKAEALAAKKAAKAQAKAQAKQKKLDAKAAKKAGKTGKVSATDKNGHQATVAGEQQTLWRPPPVADKPAKPSKPAGVALEELVAMATKRPPTHDYVKGIVDGVKFTLGQVEMHDFGKAWASWISRVGGSAKGAKAAKAAGSKKAKAKPRTFKSGASNTATKARRAVKAKRTSKARKR